MTKQELETFEEALKNSGFKKENNNGGTLLSHSSYYWYYSFGKELNTYEGDRSLYQIFVHVYDYYYYPTPNCQYNIMVEVSVSRTIDEVPIVMTYTPDEIPNLDFIKCKAQKFYNYVEDNFPIIPE